MRLYELLTNEVDSILIGLEKGKNAEELAKELKIEIDKIKATTMKTNLNSFFTLPSLAL